MNTCSPEVRPFAADSWQLASGREVAVKMWSGILLGVLGLAALSVEGKLYDAAQSGDCDRR